jgi:hypothetical protein
MDRDETTIDDGLEKVAVLLYAELSLRFVRSFLTASRTGLVDTIIETPCAQDKVETFLGCSL